MVPRSGRRFDERAFGIEKAVFILLILIAAVLTFKHDELGLPATFCNLTYPMWIGALFVVLIMAHILHNFARRQHYATRPQPISDDEATNFVSQSIRRVEADANRLARLNTATCPSGRHVYDRRLFDASPCGC